MYSITYISSTTEFHLIQCNDTTPLKISAIMISDTVENISWALGRRKGVSRIAIGWRVRCVYQGWHYIAACLASETLHCGVASAAPMNRVGR